MPQIKVILKYSACYAVLTASLAGCASSDPSTASHASGAETLPARVLAHPPDVLLLGEQHDAPEHQQWQRQTIEQWAASGRLAAVVLEMADAGHSTQAVDKSVADSAVQQALAWNDKGWPWQAYGPVVMAAVRAGVPVLGGNLPRSQLRTAQTDTSLEALLGPAALERQRQAVRDGHCGLLPESRVPGMARIQVARDQSMAQTASAARRTGQVVLLVAGAAHVKRSLGVPAHLPQSLNIKVAIAHAGKADSAIKSEADWWHATPALPPDDACDKLRQRWQDQPAR